MKTADIRGRVLKNILIFSGIVAILNYIAIKFYFYWTITWYDIPMHIFGGLLIGLGSLWVFFLSKYWNINLKPTTKNIYTVSLVCVFVVGVLWEVFEFKAGLTTSSLPDRIDTVKDLVDDIVGAIFIAYYITPEIRAYIHGEHKT